MVKVIHLRRDNTTFTTVCGIVGVRIDRDTDNQFYTMSGKTFTAVRADNPYQSATCPHCKRNINAARKRLTHI